MSVWVWAYVQYVVLYVRCTRTCTVVPSYFRKYESTFVLSKIIHPYNRSSTNTTTTYEGTCTTLYNVRVQNTYESTVHVLYTRTRTVLRNFFLRNFFFKQLLLYSTRTVQRTVQYLYSTCSLRVQLYTYNKAMLYAVHVTRVRCSFINRYSKL